jgi:para-aminobenzoate synthetase / 4-amino-4-deoxychorismate lyase
MRAAQPPRLDSALLRQFAQEPGFVLLRDAPSWRLYRNPQEVLITTDIELLQRSLRRVEKHVALGGEVAGFLPYEAGYALEPRLHSLLGRAPGRLAWFGLYDKSLICNGLSSGEGVEGSVVQDSSLAITRDKYRAKLAAISRLIEAGEVYQINFTTRVDFKTACDAWDLFNSLFRRHPVPYAAFVNTGAEQIVSLSPELFFKIDGGRIVVKPMKGTAPRGLSLEDDIQSAEGLRTSEKNRAENVMIVDLMRNDLGRICRTGSVKTPKLFEAERYPSLWQLTSTVEGKLIEGWTFESVVRALFPSGSVTGAPKIRAMEHIARLEGASRGVYTGAIGFVAPKRACFNVAIRTAVVQQNEGTMGVGGGITHDSSAAAEWEECQWKAGFLVQSEPEFRLLETLYWHGQYRFLQAHLERMKKSAEYFGVRCHESRLRAELHGLAAEFPKVPQRVRITLSRDGDWEITHSTLATERFGRVGISRKQVSSRDRFLFHKTTNRSVFDQEKTTARSQKLDDVLFLNEKGELTEGTVHNVFLVKNGVWRTPALACGLLPGIFRARVLRKQPASCEARLNLDDLTRADEVYLCNSVRGMFAVKGTWEPEKRPALYDVHESSNQPSVDKLVTV